MLSSMQTSRHTVHESNIIHRRDADHETWFTCKVYSSIVPVWGRAISRPEGLDHNAGPSVVPVKAGYSMGIYEIFFTNLAISQTVAVSISVGYRSGFPHILILSVAK